jgi:hypothetical protein
MWVVRLKFRSTERSFKGARRWELSGALYSDLKRLCRGDASRFELLSFR